jgi:ketosteroid isomerase-like protein
MQFTRRILGSMALGLASASALATSAVPARANGDVDAVNKAVQALRTAMLGADEKALKGLLSDNVVYVHSSGKLDTKADFLSIVGGKKTVYKSINIDDNKTEVTGNSAVVRHTFSGEAETDGKVNPFKVGVMQVWQKQDGAWRLYARQAFRLA